MGFAESGESVCPIAQTLAIVGERWTILVVRELFMGSKRFDEFQMYTGMSPHLLSSRLTDLEAHGIIKLRQYQDRPPRHEYLLTTKGLDLFPLIMSLKAFGDKWAKYRKRGKAAVNVIHKGCGHSTVLNMVCSECSQPYGPLDTRSLVSEHFAAEREERKNMFSAKIQAQRARLVKA